MEILLILTIGMFAYVGYWLLQNKLKPVQRASAMVARKRAISNHCYVTFALDAREVELVVPTETYISLEERQSGWLTFQGELFKNFMPDSESRPV